MVRGVIKLGPTVVVMMQFFLLILVEYWTD